MKTKLFFPLAAALLLSNVLMAQFHLGIKAGANVTKVDGKSFKDQFRYGYHLGGFAEIGFPAPSSVSSPKYCSTSIQRGWIVITKNSMKMCSTPGKM